VDNQNHEIDTVLTQGMRQLEREQALIAKTLLALIRATDLRNTICGLSRAEINEVQDVLRRRTLAGGVLL
jgi:hypothetical protein